MLHFVLESAKEKNLAELERGLTPELQRRALAYQKLATEHARKSVGDFVRNWMIKGSHWQQGGVNRVVVVFPGESLPSGLTDRPVEK